MLAVATVDATLPGSTATPPAAPDAVVASYRPDQPYLVDVHWHNNSSDEIAYEILRSYDGETFVQIGETNADITDFKDTLPSKFDVAKPITYKIVALRGAVESTPGYGGIAIPAIATTVDRAKARQLSYSTIYGDRSFNLVIIKWDLVLRDQFGRGMPGVSVGERVDLLDWHFLYGPKDATTGTAVTGPAGDFVDTDRQLFFKQGYLSSIQAIDVGDRQAIFHTNIDYTGIYEVVQSAKFREGPMKRAVHQQIFIGGLVAILLLHLIKSTQPV